MNEIGSIPSEARYFHYTSNNTIYGTQFAETPRVDKPILCDMSSDFISRPLDVSAFDLIYARCPKKRWAIGGDSSHHQKGRQPVL